MHRICKMTKLNKIRVLGIIMLLLGIFLVNYSDEKTIEFASGLIIVLGIGLIITGRIFKNKKD